MISALEIFIDGIIREELAARHGTFSFEEFSRLKTPEDRIAYCSTRLPKLGSGTARTVFELNNLNVIKVSTSSAGNDQNKVEAQAEQCSTVQGLFASVSRSASDFSWIVMEKVRPLDNGGQFKKLLKLTEYDVFSTLTYWYAQNMQNARHTQFEPENYDKVLRNPYVKKLIEVMKTCDLLPGDLSKFSSWGVTPDNRVVLIDFGLTKAIYMKHYYGR